MLGLRGPARSLENVQPSELVLPPKFLTLTMTLPELGVLVWQMGKLRPADGRTHLLKATLPEGGEDGFSPRLSTVPSRAHLD